MEGHVDGENGEACPTTTSDSATATASLEGMESRINFSSPVPIEDIVEVEAVQRWTAHWQKIKSTTYQTSFQPATQQLCYSVRQVPPVETLLSHVGIRSHTARYNISLTTTSTRFTQASNRKEVRRPVPTQPRIE